MVLIACTSPCLYQLDGCCTLEQAAASGTPTGKSTCVNFVPRPSPRLDGKHGERERQL